MIRLGIGKVREEVVTPQGLRYAIVQVTNGLMTALKGVWNWFAQIGPLKVTRFGCPLEQQPCKPP
jgi:hypothetical protein